MLRGRVEGLGDVGEDDMLGDSERQTTPDRSGRRWMVPRNGCPTPKPNPGYALGQAGHVGLEVLPDRVLAGSQLLSRAHSHLVGVSKSTEEGAGLLLGVLVASPVLQTGLCRQRRLRQGPSFQGHLGVLLDSHFTLEAPAGAGDETPGYVVGGGIESSEGSLEYVSENAVLVFHHQPSSTTNRPSCWKFGAPGLEREESLPWIAGTVLMALCEASIFQLSSALLPPYRAWR